MSVKKLSRRMRVTYNQTPPPLVEEHNGEVRVNKQLIQVSMIGFSGAEMGCVKMMKSLPLRLVYTVGSSLVVRDMDTGGQQVLVGHRYPIIIL